MKRCEGCGQEMNKPYMVDGEVRCYHWMENADFTPIVRSEPPWTSSPEVNRTLAAKSEALADGGDARETDLDDLQ